MANRASEQAEAETNMRQAALEGIGNTLSSDVKPTVLEVEGKTVELKGTIEQQFSAWRDVLKELRENETAPLQKPTTPQKSPTVGRSEEHTSELQSLMRISYAVFCLKK